MDEGERGDGKDSKGPKTASSRHLTRARFSRIHALVVLSGAFVGVLTHSLWPVTLTGVASLLWYLLRGELPCNTARFHAANGVTALRLLALLPLASFGHVGPPAALLVMAILAMDGLDGWLARTRRMTSELGAHFDMESDALLVMVSCSMLFLSGDWGLWVLSPGLLRYLYVLILWSGAFEEAPPSTFGRWIFFLFALVLICSLWPLGPWTVPVMFVASSLVVISFSRSLRWSIS